MSSMSFGVTNWWPDDLAADVGEALLERVDHVLAERLALRVVPRPRRRRGGTGAYCTKQLITCLPGGAIVGSTSVGMMQSMYGRADGRPYFASS